MLILLITGLLASEQGSRPVAAEVSVIRFLPDGRITSLLLGGEELVKEAQLRNGFSVLTFNGTTVREYPLVRITRKDGGWLLQGEKDFPRFTCSFAAEEKQLCLRLLRIEGVPVGKDSTLVLTLGTRKPLQVAGKGVESETQNDSLKIYWKFIGAPNALATFGNVLIGVKP
ncbi:MAG: hypothetical protein WCP12_16535 [bacterium]